MHRSIFGWTAAAALTGLITAGVSAEDPAKPAPEGKRPFAKRGEGPLAARRGAMPAAIDPAELFKKLDADGDGKLTPEEFAKFREVMAAAKPAAGADGKPDADRIKALREKITGSDGKPDPEKLAALKERLGKMEGRIPAEKLAALRERLGLDKKDVEKKE